MVTRDEALTEIVEIARRHGLSSAEIARALAPAQPAPPTKRQNVLGRILAYLGGILILAGISVFIGFNWSAMNSAARVIISLGSGLAIFVLGLIAMQDARYKAARTPLLLIAAALQPTGILVAINEYSSGGDWRYAVLIAAGIMAVQQGLVFWRYRTSTLLFTTVFFGLWFLGVTFDLLDATDKTIAMLLGGSLVGFCIGLDKTRYRNITPLYYFVGTGSFFGGFFAWVEGTAIELLFLGVACGGLVLSTHLRSRTMLIVSTVAILGYISYFTAQHFVDSVGWPIALIILGLILIGLSALGLRLNRRFISDA